MKRRAEMGVGTLIIFISLLLVAAIAAGVLIQTAGSLQQRALSTGTQATGQISTNAVVVELSGEDGQDQDLENLTMIVKLAPGSDPMKLDDLTMTLSTSSESTTLSYLAPIGLPDYCAVNATLNSTDPQFCANTNGASGNFTVEYLQTGANYQFGRISRGDVLAMYFETASPLAEGVQARINIIPKIGTTTQVLFDVPDVVSTQQVYLYP